MVVPIASMEWLLHVHRALVRLNASRPQSAATQENPFWGKYPFRLLDTRTMAVPHVPASGGIPSAALSKWQHALPPRHRPVLVLSSDPNEARAAASFMTSRGWTTIAIGDPVSTWPGPWAPGPPTARLWEPSPLVRRWAHRIPPGPVLDLGAGAGRDAVYLALRGHAAYAVDRLPDALDRAAALARRHGVCLTGRGCLDLDRRGAPEDLARAFQGTWPARFAAILMVRYLSRRCLEWIADRLQPGGLFLLEAFVRPPSGESPIRPRARLLEHGEACNFFPDWKLLEHSAGRLPTGEPVARLVAQRPAMRHSQWQPLVPHSGRTGP